MALDNPSYFTIPGQQKASVMVNSLESEPSSIRKRSYRNLLRSLSSNSADSNQELLIMGQPRLSDIAPELSHQFAGGEPRRANSLKSSKSDTNGYVDSDDEEVFLNEETARYYNLSTKAGSEAVANRRRHSISSFAAKESRSGSTATTASAKSFSRDDFPQGSAVVHASADGSPALDDHSLRHGSYPRKRCTRCTRGSAKRSPNMNDILIVSVKESDAASLWVDYFVSYFDQISRHSNRIPYKINHLLLEDVIEANGDITAIAERAAGVKLQLIVLCPTLLDKIADNVQATSALSKILLPDRILALQLGTTDADVADVHKHALLAYSQWQRKGLGCEQDQDEKFAGEFIAMATSIFTRVLREEPTIFEMKSQFSISPKKIRQGQTSVLILLDYPLQREDVVKVTVVRNNDFTEVKTVKRRNAYTVKIAVPDKFLEVAAIVNVLVEKNGNVIGKRPLKCESRLRELEQVLRSANNPVEFMCQTLGISPQDHDQLDTWMVQNFQKNIPPNFNLFINHDSYTGEDRCEEFPTLLHFAARFGLDQLAVQLVECPGGEQACEIRNDSDLCPADLAKKAGHSELSQMLQSYIKMNEFSKAYMKFKSVTKDVNVKSLQPPSISAPTTPTIEEEGYLIPNNIQEFYKLCPAPKPVLLPISFDDVQYLAMDAGKQAATSPTSPSASFDPLLKLKPRSHHSSHASITSSREDRNAAKPGSCMDKVQTELAEIMNDFKNNVHSLSQTEELVREWENRTDVRQSLKEKNEQLKQMRAKYDRIQKEMKSNAKKPSTFDRIKRIFGGKSSKEEKPTSQRPISSLSLQSTTSSTSSGRSSTISGCSLGDSGTHSDHEDRKVNTSSEDEFPANYMIPPAPKPVKYPKSRNFPTIEERPPIPNPRLSDDAYYIQFPPNGLPVEGTFLEELSETSQSPQPLESPTTACPEYMNLVATKRINTDSSESLSEHLYMNFHA